MDAISDALFARLSWVLSNPKELQMSMETKPKEQGAAHPTPGSWAAGRYSFVEAPAMLLDSIMCPERGPLTFSFNEIWGPGPVGAGSALLRVRR